MNIYSINLILSSLLLNMILLVVLWIPIDCSLANSIWWLIVSKAAVKSSNMRITKRLFFMLLEM